MLFMMLAFESDADKQKFEYIYSKYKNLLLHKAFQILKDRMLAEDAVSEAFIRIYKNLHKIDDPTSNQSVAFIVTIARNTSFTILEKETKKSTEQYDETLEDSFDLEQHIISQISSEKIYEIINKLNEELRSVFLFKYGHDLSNKEISKMLGISENNVAVRLNRAKKKLADMLVKEEHMI